MTSFRSSVPQVFAPIDRVKQNHWALPWVMRSDALQTYLGSSYVNLFTKFGQVFQVYVQGDASSRMTIDDVRHFYVKNLSGKWCRLAR